MTDWTKPRAYAESAVKPKPIDWFDADIQGLMILRHHPYPDYQHWTEMPYWKGLPE